MKPREGKDRRQHPRIPARIPVDVIGQEKNKIPAETEDISLGGALLLSQEELTREREFTLHFYLANLSDDPIMRRGRIAHVQSDTKVGVQFTDADPAAEKAIWRYMLFKAGGKSTT